MKLVVAGIITRKIGESTQFLVCQRSKDQAMPLQWEFPGGKVEQGEVPESALRRELQEELGIDAQIGAEVMQIEHRYHNGMEVRLRFYSVPSYEGEIENRIFEQILWVTPGDIAKLDFLQADAPIVEAIQTGTILPATTDRQAIRSK